MKSARILLDTCIYISWIRERHLDILEESRRNIIHFSAIVYSELLTGAFTAKDQKLVKSIRNHFEYNNRFQGINASIAQDVGDVLRVIERPKESIFADVIIAMTGKHIGAEIWTQNAKDFEAINKIKAFKLRTFTSKLGNLSSDN
jgi:predicted nucleic acid-binding protein